MLFIYSYIDTGKVFRGEIYLADLGDHVHSIQGGVRPVLILQNDIGNKHSTTVIVAPITTKKKRNLITHVQIRKNCCGLKKDSVVLLEQIVTIEKCELKFKIGSVDVSTMKKINTATIASLDLDNSLSRYYGRVQTA